MIIVGSSFESQKIRYVSFAFQDTAFKRTVSRIFDGLYQNIWDNDFISQSWRTCLVYVMNQF